MLSEISEMLRKRIVRSADLAQQRPMTDDVTETADRRPALPVPGGSSPLKPFAWSA
jgi:hypothetical protein